MSLQDEIDSHRKEIHTDAYQMSIGEIVNLYRDGDLNIHPEFQRFFRWKEKQKSRWIESIVLGIPLPSIFVAQRADGVWDVIDGLQRLSTIFEFMGELKDENGKKVRPLVLEETRLLPSLKGKSWSTGGDHERFTDDQQRFVKRAKLDVKIILRESHESRKYELFRRLNTGGSFLSDQELRSAFLVGTNRGFFDKIVKLSRHTDFKACVPLTENQEEEQYDRELVIRFLVLWNIGVAALAKIDELGEFLTDAILDQASKGDIGKKEEAAFGTAFALLRKALGEDSFRKYRPHERRFSGPFLISAFEVIALGLGYHSSSAKHRTADWVRDTVTKRVWADDSFLTSSGVRASQRLPKTIARGRELFAG